MGGVYSTPQCLRGGQSAFLSPSSKAQYLELLLHQERKNHYLQMTSLCKNASSGGCRAELQGRGGKKGLRACQSRAAPASGTLKHLRTTSAKLLNASGLQSPHLQSERPDLGIVRSPCCWETPEPVTLPDQVSEGLWAAGTGRPPRHREPRVSGGKRKVITLPNWATHRTLVPPKCSETDSSCRAGHLCYPPAQFLSGVWWCIVNQQRAGNSSPGGLLSWMDKKDPQFSIFPLGGPQEAKVP